MFNERVSRGVYDYRLIERRKVRARQSLSILSNRLYNNCQFSIHVFTQKQSTNVSATVIILISAGDLTRFTASVRDTWVPWFLIILSACRHILSLSVKV